MQILGKPIYFSKTDLKLSHCYVGERNKENKEYMFSRKSQRERERERGGGGHTSV